MSVLNELSPDTGTRIYTSTDPEYQGWQLVTEEGNPDKNPNNGVVAMESFNGHIYAGTGGAEGIELWRTKGFEPQQDKWIKVIDKKDKWELIVQLVRNIPAQFLNTVISQDFSIFRGFCCLFSFLQDKSINSK